jgi:hypothetical protein
LVGLSPKKLWNPLLSPSKNHIFYNFFHNQVKSYKCVFLHLHCFTRYKTTLHSFAFT